MRLLPKRLLGAAAAAALVTTASACGFFDDSPQRSSDYNQTEAIPVMESLVAEAIEPLPDFPGFGERVWGISGCYGGLKGLDEHKEFVELKLTYYLVAEDWDEASKREGYAEVLREHWNDLGYEVDVDRTDGTGEFSRLGLTRDDGLAIAFFAGGKVGFEVYTGCIDRTDEMHYVPPVGGVAPEHDRARGFM
ncbi:hypothetical protein [Natronoglycomyces albus]|uniref:Lipoprotein n=1 Tax=Natronoglycomyces albus TaxID=2811108 RepID=A0A895XRY5_9ACTN|nr:hypothetical protein [Natronoglycomyces albus]QSB06099.1 hypothetical protein JQS30_04050 [Natronoglycomyces albus]